MAACLLVKAHVKGYAKKDGTYVRPHDRSGESAAPARPAPNTALTVHHPRNGDNGEAVAIHTPSHPSAPSTWHNPDAVATFTPDGDVPASLNGVHIAAWRDHPRTVDGWEYVDGINHGIHEPAFTLPPGKKAAAGVVIEEADGRVWLIHPTNQFGGYEASMPKGTVDPGLSLQATAIKEAFEETGLKVEITGFLGDFDRTTSKARIYRAKRVGGDPTRCGWESQAVSLCPKGLLYEHLNMWADHGIAEAIGAGPAPSKAKPE